MLLMDCLSSVSKFFYMLLCFFSTNFMIWNARGAGNAAFIRYVKNYIDCYHVNVLVILETKIGGRQDLRSISKIGWSGRVRVDPIGFSGGIWLL